MFRGTQTNLSNPDDEIKPNRYAVLEVVKNGEGKISHCNMPPIFANF